MESEQKENKKPRRNNRALKNNLRPDFDFVKEKEIRFISSVLVVVNIQMNKEQI